MSIIRRYAALVTCLMLLQLTMLERQVACDTHGGNESTGLARHARTHSPAPALGDDCGEPDTTGACASMPACAVTLGVPAHAGTSVTLLSPLASLPEPVSTHSHIVAGPDVPPPRG
jgi:hypothetical protein